MQHVFTLNIWEILTQGNCDKFSVQFHLLMLSSCNDDDDDEDYDDDDDDDDDDEDYDDKEGSDKEGGRPLCVSLLPVNCTASDSRLHCAVCLDIICHSNILDTLIQGFPKKRTFRMLLEPLCTGSITSGRHPLCLEINFLVVSY